MSYKSIKPLLFALSPEKAHGSTMSMLNLFLKLPGGKYVLEKYTVLENPLMSTEFCGLQFRNPVGLAAGFDKDGKYFRVMASLGFGFIEIGTVTPRPQAGNPRPRLFRLPKDQALLNRMGFNNEGVEALVKRLESGRPEGLILGGNIGKNKDTANEDAVNDYRICFERLHPFVDYFVVNVSSPNTPGLRALQEKEPLERLLSTLKEMDQKFQNKRPILLKIAPDVNPHQLDDIYEVIVKTGTDGIVATNTTLSREGLLTYPAELNKMGLGGISGKPLHDRSNDVIRYLSGLSGGILPIIGVGGIHSSEAAMKKIEAGATLIQLYTGLVYEGPALVKQIKNKIIESKS